MGAVVNTFGYYKMRASFFWPVEDILTSERLRSIRVGSLVN